MSKYKGKMITQLVYSGYIPFSQGIYQKLLYDGNSSYKVTGKLYRGMMSLSVEGGGSEVATFYGYNEEALEKLKTKLSLIENRYGNTKPDRDTVTCGF